MRTSNYLLEAVFVIQFRENPLWCGKRMKKGNSNNYFAWLIRFWRESGTNSWRVTVEDPHTNQKTSFAQPDECWQFLQTILVNPEMDITVDERVNDE